MDDGHFSYITKLKEKKNPMKVVALVVELLVQFGCGVVGLVCLWICSCVGLVYQGKKDIVCRFIIEYSSSLMDVGPY
jgi:hypothetical protein